MTPVAIGIAYPTPIMPVVVGVGVFRFAPAIVPVSVAGDGNATTAIHIAAFILASNASP